jgi:hypothetical protein
MNTLRTLLFSGLSLLLLATAQPASAQVRPRQQPAGGRLTQLDNARIAFITGRVLLTQDQAQRFWPLYHDFIAKRRHLNRSTRLLRRDAASPSLSDAQLRDNFNQDFALRQQQLNMEKDYFERVQKVLSLHQVAQLYQAERDFTKEVLRRVGSPAAGQPSEE